MNFFKKNKYKVLLIIIILIASVFRFVNLEENPPAMHADEADTVYTAYSLLKTGKDPYGVSWPLHFQAQSGAYRAPLYTYSTMIPVAIFGMNEFSARINSIVFGIVFILVMYKLLDYYSGSKKVAFIGAFVAACNPWLIHISRTGLEIQMSLTFVALGVLFFHLGSIRMNKYIYLLSSLFFGLSIHTYNAPKVFVPFIICILAWYHFKNIGKMKLATVFFIIIFGLSYSVMGYLSIFKKGATELRRVGIFDEVIATEIVNSERTLTRAPLLISSIFSNKPMFYIREFTNKYVGPLSPNYLFINGEASLDKGIGNYGQFHFFEILPFSVGIYLVFRKSRKLFLFLVFWFLTSLIPGGITKSGYYAYRDVNLIPVVIVFTSTGVLGLWQYAQKKLKLKKSFIIFGTILICFPIFVYYTYIYYFNYPVVSRDWWGWNIKEALSYTENEKSKYDGILIHGGSDWDILYAFYTKIQPAEFQKAHMTKVDNNRSISRINDYYIGDIIKNDSIQSSVPYNGNTFLLIAPGDSLREKDPKKNFYGKDGVHVELKAYSVIRGEDSLNIVQGK